MRLAKKIVFSALGTTISVLSGLLRNKIMAVFLSLNLFGIISLGQQTVSLAFTVFALGLPLAITTLTARTLSKAREEQVLVVSRIVVLALLLAAAMLMLLLMISLLDAEFLSRFITGSGAHALPMTLLLSSAALLLLETCLYSIMEGMGQAKAIFMFKAIPALIGLPMLYVAVAAYGVLGAAIGILVTELLFAGTGLFLLRSYIVLHPGAFNVRPVIAEVYKVALLSFLVGTMWFVVDFVIKRHVLLALGEVENGIIQSVAKITDLYPTIALAWLSLHLFPTLSAYGADKRAAANAVQRTALVAVVLIIPIVVLLFALKREVLQIVYNREFTIAADYFGAMLSTGIIKVFSWTVGLALLPLGLRREWFISAILLTGFYGLGVWLMFSYQPSMYALPLATGVGLVVQSVYVLGVYRKNGYTFDSSFLGQVSLYLSISALLVASIFEPHVLIGIAVLFFYVLYRNNLITEVRERIDEVRKKIVE
jgi:O-antigen/teichoic acid export membrane protein